LSTDNVLQDGLFLRHLMIGYCYKACQKENTIPFIRLQKYYVCNSNCDANSKVNGLENSAKLRQQAMPI